MKKINTIKDEELDNILKANKSDDFYYDRNKIILDGILFYRASIVNEEHSTKSTAQSLIKKEPEFDFSFMDEVYEILSEFMTEQDFVGIKYARVMAHNKFKEEQCKYQLDLYSAYPHILKYEKLPIDGALYYSEDSEKMNFYRYEGKYLRNGCLITDDLKDYVITHGLGDVKYLFSTDYKIGSKMGDKLIEMVYKNKKTKADAKNIHYGYYQKKYLSYIAEDDCYARDPRYNKELLMVAVCSQLTYIMLKIRDILGIKGRPGTTHFFVTDAVIFNDDIDIAEKTRELNAQLSNYDYRIYDTKTPSDDDRHGTIIYKTYADLKDAPRSHHKKVDK